MTKAENYESCLPTEMEVEEEALSGVTFFGRLFKVARCERPVFTYMSVILFLVSYIYSVSRDMKDAIIIERLDPASIPYLKILVVLPVNICIVFTIQKILISTPVSKVFSIMCIIFGIYFCLYGTVLMSFRHVFELNEFLIRDWFADEKMVFMGLQWTIALALPINSWTSSLMYLSAEIWGTVVFQFLFFALSNEIYTQKQSLRFIPLFLVFGNVALIVSGFSMKFIKYVSEQGSYEFTVFFRKLVFVLMGICSFVIYFIHRYFENNIAHKPLFATSKASYKQKTKSKIGFMDAMKTMASSRLVLAMSFVVMAYSVSVNMVEASFKTCMSQYALQKGAQADFHVMGVQSDIQLAVGALSIILLLSSFPALIRDKGFSYVAFVPPIFCIFGMASVFGMAALNNSARDNRTLLGFVSIGENLWLEQLLGAIIVTGFKILKYSAVDVSKEALSMRINPVYRARFKGIYDGVCGKLGKALGSGITNMQNVFYNSSDVRKAAISSLTIVTVITACWGLAVRYLAGKYDKSIHSNTDIDIDVINRNSMEKDIKAS